MANEFRAGDLAVFPPIRFGPYEYSLADRLHAPDRVHYLGTDISGRDVLTRLIYGTHISLIVGFFSVTIALAIGLTIGSCAGYFGGWVDAVLLRVIEIFMCFPTSSSS